MAHKKRKIKIGDVVTYPYGHEYSGNHIGKVVRRAESTSFNIGSYVVDLLVINDDGINKLGHRIFKRVELRRASDDEIAMIALTGLLT